MAEFKLGRIRFVWKNEWSPSTEYYKDDVIKFGGRTYICDVGHTSAPDFYTDLNYSPTRWNQMTDGTDFIGDWSSSTTYKVNDIVKYGGRLYIAQTPHTPSAGDAIAQDAGSAATNGLEADISNWNAYAEGVDFKGSWSTSNRYKVNDVVVYGGIQYICTGGHTSSPSMALGLEEDTAYWAEFSEGIEYKGDWTADTGSGGTRYKLNDVVKYGAGLYICTTPYTSSASFETDEANWQSFVKGFEFESDWSDSTVYNIGDVVKYGGNQYIAITNHSGTTPTAAGNSDWQLFTEGFSFQDVWSFGTDYKIGEVVVKNGFTYLAVADITSLDIEVTATDAGTNNFTTDDTSALEAGLALQFSGSLFGDVSDNAIYYVKTVVDGTNFTITDKPDGTVITPISGTGTMNVIATPHPENVSYWSQLSAGLKWQGTWTDDNEYFKGDVVLYGTNAYVCVLNHRSEGDDGSTIREEGGGLANSRPDQDFTGTYWNVFTIGDELGVLTTRGDLVYYGGAGPVRLPIGYEGQVLVAGESDPEWKTLYNIDHVFYVAPTGTDLPAPVHGKTLDKPFKTVRYAAEQVEKGPKVPNSAYLLEMNRAFIQRETSAWIKYQITNDIAPFTSSFDFEDYKCERDVGYILDAFIYDLRHGGNEKSREVALSYVNDAPKFYTLGQEEETVAAINYMITLTNNILNQEAPDANYQELTGDYSTAIIEQFFDPTITIETDYATSTGATGYLGGYTGVSGSSGSQSPTYGGGY